MSPFRHARPASAAYAHLTIPHPLIADLQDTPLAIGLYSLIARQFIITKTSVPLSTPDVLRYDPSLSRGAVLRAFARLIAGGWVTEIARAGHKTCYTPCWGVVRGSARPWQPHAPLFDRPRRQNVVRLDQRLLDTCVGKLTPHPIRTALIERYVTSPLLGLADIGAYIVTLAGKLTPTARLQRLGLVRDGRAIPVPSDTRLLAIGSQLTLEDDTAAVLTDRGLQRLGVATCQTLDETPAHSQPLFFVPEHLIGTLIDSVIAPMIGQDTARVTTCTASERDEQGLATSGEGSHEQDERNEHNEIHPPTPPHVAGSGGGCGSSQNEIATDGKTTRQRRVRPPQAPQVRPEQDAVSPVAETETTHALRAINVLPEQVLELHHLPFETIQAALRDAETRPGIRDRAGWVVHLLRNARDYGWKIQPPRPHPDSAEARAEAFAQYARLQEAETESDAPGGVHDLQHVTEQDVQGGEQGEASENCVTPALPLAENSEVPGLNRVRLWNTVLGSLQARISRQEFNTWFRRAALHAVLDGLAVITVPTVMHKRGLEERYHALLRELLSAHAAVPLDVWVALEHEATSAQERPTAADGDEIGLTRATKVATTPSEHRPLWIDAEQWETLPSLLHALLRGSRWEEGEIHGASVFVTTLLRTRHAGEVARLVASVEC
jgi:hypothetical protein